MLKFTGVMGHSWSLIFRWDHNTVAQAKVLELPTSNTYFVCMWLSEMEREDVMETATKCGRHAFRMVRHFHKYAKKCIEVGIPAPFAAEMTRNASQSLEDLGFEGRKKLCYCFRCNLDLTSTKTVSFRLSVPKRKVKKNKWKRYKRPIQLIAVCKGCGAEMKGGALATVEYKMRCMQTFFDQSLKRESRRFPVHSAFSSPGTSFQETPTSTQVMERKISSSGRRRKLTSKLQRILNSQTPVRRTTSLQGFLEAFKISIDNRM
ncbi:hypothetical protein LOAG_01057 [Loa loa]|uniref:Uncharacterized protein n=2 Tax=Loa loa TaxID=7209 RepID=A0A1S0U9Q5_LOALO|nr:hypothetical protein LOAG_01057 [Loa loa]EFO27421.2 hypothetical protein LOAG_01057 [Loa loa]